MQKPITKVSVNREHANTGDVLVSLNGGEPFHIPGDVTAFTALRMLGPWLEKQLAERAAGVIAESTPAPLPVGLAREGDDGSLLAANAPTDAPPTENPIGGEA